MECVECHVSGRVQGVWFRETTRQKALSLELRGEAVNLPDGRVRVVICGNPGQVEQLQAWLWTGSPLSKVTAVECRRLSKAPEYAGFSTG